MTAHKAPNTARAGSTSVGPVLVVDGLVKDFDGRVVLNGLDFSLAPGQSTALIGANGSGKSTLLKCLIRLIEPSAGQIHMLGREVCGLHARELRTFRAQVGIVWQRHNLVPRLSVLSNVIHGVQSRLSGPRAWFQALSPAAVRGTVVDVESFAPNAGAVAAPAGAVAKSGADAVLIAQGGVILRAIAPSRPGTSITIGAPILSM